MLLIFLFILHKYRNTSIIDQKHLSKFLEDLLLGKLNPFIQSHLLVLLWVVLHQQLLQVRDFLVLVPLSHLLVRVTQLVLQWSLQQLGHHRWERPLGDQTILIAVLVREDFYQEPVKLQVLRVLSVGSLLDELQVFCLGTKVKDGMRCNGGGFGRNVLHAEPVPFIKGDHPGALEVHGVEHLLPGGIPLLIRLVELGVWRSVSVSSWDGGGLVHKLGEGLATDQSSKLVSASTNIFRRAW